MPRYARILSDDELSQLLSVKRLPLPEKPKVVDIKFEDYEDWAGDETKEVFIILEEGTPEDQPTLDELQPTYQAINDVFIQAHDPRLPYITAMTPSEFAQRYSYDPSSDE
jgi:hypothetical protein